jgi:transcriptional regulator with XRE-family HTH domain
VDREAIGRRIRAARALGVPSEAELARRKRPQPGLTHDDVADRIGLDGYSAKTIGNMERGDTPALRPALTEIAKACGIDPAFFDLDVAHIGADGDGRVDQLEQRLETLAQDHAERLDRIDEVIRRDVAPLMGQREPQRTAPADEPAPVRPGKTQRRQSGGRRGK